MGGKDALPVARRRGVEGPCPAHRAARQRRLPAQRVEVLVRGVELLHGRRRPRRVLEQRLDHALGVAGLAQKLVVRGGFVEPADLRDGLRRTVKHQEQDVVEHTLVAVRRRLDRCRNRPVRRHLHEVSRPAQKGQVVTRPADLFAQDHHRRGRTDHGCRQPRVVRARSQPAEEHLSLPQRQAVRELPVGVHRDPARHGKPPLAVRGVGELQLRESRVGRRRHLAGERRFLFRLPFRLTVRTARFGAVPCVRHPPDRPVDVAVAARARRRPAHSGVGAGKVDDPRGPAPCVRRRRQELDRLMPGTRRIGRPREQELGIRSPGDDARIVHRNEVGHGTL